MLNISKNILDNFKENETMEIKIFFYKWWCSGTKLNITDKFIKDSTVSFLEEIEWVKIYVDKLDKNKFKDCNILQVKNTDHTWIEKVKYVYKSNFIWKRCWCWTSFAFSEWHDKRFDLKELWNIKNIFKK